MQLLDNSINNIKSYKELLTFIITFYYIYYYILKTKLNRSLEKN